MACRPSRLATSASNVITPSVDATTANAPTGTWHPPSRWPSSARSAAVARRVGLWSSVASSASADTSSARTCTAMAPWPGAGSITCGDSTSRTWPVRFEPSQSRQREHRGVEVPGEHRVDPRRHVAAQVGRRRSGRGARSAPAAAVTRCRRAPVGSAPGPSASATSASRGVVALEDGSQRNPTGGSVGKSFRLCTARSIVAARRPSSRSR